MCFGLSLKENKVCAGLLSTHKKRKKVQHRENNHRMPESDDQILPTKKKENIMGGRMSLHCSRSQT